MHGICVGLEGLYDPGNRSSIYRSAEGLGLYCIDVIYPEAARKSQARQVSRGAEKWIEVRTHKTTALGIASLRERGYQIAAADLEHAQPLEAVDFARPTALVFGNERDGISDELRQAADCRFRLPMQGFAESFNVSVAAAMSMSIARTLRERAIGAATDLDEDQRRSLRARYLRLATGSAELILERAQTPITT